jgi:hypothetical protein
MEERMGKLVKYFLWMIVLGWGLSVNAQTDFFKIPSIKLGKSEYELKWSARVHYNTRYIAEYLLPGESYTRYKTKVIITYDTDRSLDSISKVKLRDLKEKKDNGSVLHYQVLKSVDTGEFIVEYMVGDVREGKTLIAEWNIYRYRPNGDGAVLFAMSKRAYGENEVKEFMKEVNKNREDWIKSITEYNLPVILLKN